MNKKNLLYKLASGIIKIMPNKFEHKIKDIYYKRFYNKSFREKSPNVDHSKKLIFIHIPKNAGNSVKETLGLNINKTSHSLPTYLVHKKTWESYFKFIVVRHPFDRLISSYFYHTQKNYNGYYLNKYPNLKKYNFTKYFKIFSKETNALRPQSDYLYHKYSNKKVDRVLYFENLEYDLQFVLKKFNISRTLPHLNSSKKNLDTLVYDNEFIDKVNKFYEDDYVNFNYDKNINQIIKKYLS